MSLKAIAAETLARIRSGEMGHETEEETAMKYMKQAAAVFHGGLSRSLTVKHAQPQKTVIADPCFTVSLSRGGNNETGSETPPWGQQIVRLRHLQTATIEDLQAAYPNTRLTPQRWRRMLMDADAFLRDWGEQAGALGWGALDVFGCSPGFARRYDRDGLVTNLDGAVVLAMTEATAKIDAGRGARQTYRRADKQGAVTWWQALSEGRVIGAGSNSG